MLKIYTATKNQSCGLCGEVILEGERFWAEQTYNGFRRKQHLNCAEHEKEPVQERVDEFYNE